MTWLTRDVERACAALLPRSILGFVYLFAGIHKLLDPGALAYGQALALGDGARFLPAAMITAAGTAVPFIEIALGFLLLIGLWSRRALHVLAALLLLITAGYGISGLLHPVGATAMNIGVVNTFILPRAALIIVALMMPASYDRWSIDALRGLGASVPSSRLASS